MVVVSVVYSYWVKWIPLIRNLRIYSIDVIGDMCTTIETIVIPWATVTKKEGAETDFSMAERSQLFSVSLGSTHLFFCTQGVLEWEKPTKKNVLSEVRESFDWNWFKYLLKLLFLWFNTKYSITIMYVHYVTFFFRMESMVPAYFIILDKWRIEEKGGEGWRDKGSTNYFYWT